jgi:hypothetical protein
LQRAEIKLLFCAWVYDCAVDLFGGSFLGWETRETGIVVKLKFSREYEMLKFLKPENRVVTLLEGII